MWESERESVGVEEAEAEAGRQAFRRTLCVGDRIVEGKGIKFTEAQGRGGEGR